MLIDSDILIDCARGEAKAIAFVEKSIRDGSAKVSAVSQMEMIVGCRNKRELNALGGFLARFNLVHLSTSISVKAVELLSRYRSSHGLMIPDAMIAATALLESEPLVTRNRRHFEFVKDLKMMDY